MTLAHYFERQADGETPAGFTVSKKPDLPEGDFRITEFSWNNLSLWFIDADRFTADERQNSYREFLLWRAGK